METLNKIIESNDENIGHIKKYIDELVNDCDKYFRQVNHDKSFQLRNAPSLLTMSKENKYIDKSTLIYCEHVNTLINIFRNYFSKLENFDKSISDDENTKDKQTDVDSTIDNDENTKDKQTDVESTIDNDEIMSIDILDLMNALFEENNEKQIDKYLDRDVLHNKYLFTTKTILNKIFATNNAYFINYVIKRIDFASVGKFIIEHKDDLFDKVTYNVITIIIKNTIESFAHYNDISKICDIFNIIKLEYKHELNFFCHDFEYYNIYEQFAIIGCTKSLYLLLQKYKYINDIDFLYVLNDHAQYYNNVKCSNMLTAVIDIYNNINKYDNDYCVFDLFCIKCKMFY